MVLPKFYTLKTKAGPIPRCGSRSIPVSVARTVKWADLNIVRNEKKIFQKHILKVVIL